MDKVVIEKYRGFDIEFDTHYEKFSCIITEDDTKESVSYTAVKRFIDEYKKNNQKFTPFWVETNPAENFWGKEKPLKIIGVRKDGRFMAEDLKGKKQQVSDYDIKGYMLVKECNKEIKEVMAKLERIDDRRRRIYERKRKELIEKLDITTLKSFKLKLEQ